MARCAMATMLLNWRSVTVTCLCSPGVKIPDHLVEQFPDEMTIVVQHQYWDLEVHDGHFEIILKFNRVPQHLSIPYVAMTRFVDPAVNFGVSFEKAGTSEETDVVAPAPEAAEPESSDSGAQTGPRTRRTSRQ